MKRLRDRPSSSSSDEQKKTLLRDTIKCLTDPKSGSGLSYQPYEVQARQKPKEVDFLHKLHGWLMRGKEKKSKVQSDKNSVELKGRVEKLEKQVQQLKQQIDKFQHKDGFDDHERELSLFQGKVFVGTKFGKNTRKILRWLKKPEACVIGVWGMGGVGKTELLKHISNKLIQDSTTSWPVYWLTLTHCDTIYKWQECFAKCIGLDLHDEDDETKRARKLYNTLAKMGNVVLMLDDMWHCFCAHDVGVPLGENSCKIILTTRLLDVCRRMRCKDLLITVRRLCRDEAMKLFVDKIQNYDMLSEKVRKIAGVIVDKCYGLPLAIVTMASRMIGVTDVDEWNDTCDELEMHEQADMQNKVFSNLYRSYCFSDGIAQESFLSIIFNYHLRLDIDSYIDLLSDEGLLDKLEYGEKRMRKGCAIIEKLYDSCLLESEDSDANGLIKGMALHYARENHTHLMMEESELKEMPIDDIWSVDLVRVSLRKNTIERIRLDMSPQCVKLKVLILKQNPLEEIPECFFEHMISLTVLDLSETRIKRLPNSVSNLKNLRTLDLYGCDELTDVGAITKLMKLRKLHLCGAHVDEAVTAMESLKYLEVFGFTLNASHWSHFDRLMESWPFCSIRSYHFSIQDEIKPHRCYRGRCYGGGPEVKELEIKGVELGREIKNLHLPFGIKRLVIIECEVKGSGNLGDVLPSLHTATKLKRLYLWRCLGMEYVLSAIPPGASMFPQLNTLEVLSLYYMPDLRGIIKIEGNETEQPSQIPQSIVAFSHLQHISIDSCPKIKSVIPFNLIQHPRCLSNLGSISLRNCEGLENIFEFLPSPSPCPLNIWGGPQLGGAYLSLKKLEISGCNEIKEVFSFDLVQNLQPFLPNLEEIDVRECEKVEAMFGSPNSTTSRAVDLRKLTTLRLNNLPELRSICSGVLLSSLRTLDILGCDGIKEVFQLDLSQSQPLLSTLESICVRYCQNLEVVIASSNDGANPILELPRLAQLHLSGLPNFQSIYRGMLICTALDEPDIEEFPNYRPLEQLSKPLFCDASEKTLASIPKYDGDNPWWGHLKSSYPEDASTLSKLVDDFWASRQSWGFNLSTISPNSVPFQSGTAAVNPVFALPPFGMNHSTTEGFSNAVFIQHTWTVSDVVEVDNPNLMLGAMNAQSVSQLPYDESAPFPVNNRGSYDGAGCSYNIPGAGNYQPFNQ